MKRGEQIDLHEVLRRWAVGELSSRFSAVQGGEERVRAKQQLESGITAIVEKATGSVLGGRKSLIDSIPSKTDWYLAELELSDGEFRSLRHMNDEGWLKLSNRTGSLVEAANRLRSIRDARVEGIRSAMSCGRVEMTGITLIGRPEEEAVTVVEGHGRLVAIYLDAVQGHAGSQGSIECVLGLSSQRWCWPPTRTAQSWCDSA